MIEKPFLVLIVLIIVILSFFSGVLVGNKFSPAALSIPLLNNPLQNLPQPTRTCINQKCVAVSNQCSIDSNCATHTECSSQSQCITVNGPGANKCSANGDCVAIKDPQTWCKTKNPGLNSVATVYPNGNFSCVCYSTNNISSRAQLPCSNQHQNQ